MGGEGTMRTCQPPLSTSVRQPISFNFESGKDDKYILDTVTEIFVPPVAEDANVLVHS